MKVIEPGHIYQLQSLDGSPYELLTFVKRIGEKYPGNKGAAHPGTTIQEVCRALISRVEYVDGQIPNWRNKFVVLHLRAVIHLLELRAAERHGRELKAHTAGIERLPTCPTCGHIECAEHAEAL